MNPRLRACLTSATPALMRAASWFVPARQRSEWLAEWKAELWHVTRETTEEQALQFAAGAVQDAICLWCERPWPQPRLALRRGSASSCLGALTILTVAGFLACLAIPHARKVLFMPMSAGRHAVVITTSFAGIDRPTIRYAEYERWTQITGHIFRSLAFFQPRNTEIHVAGQGALPLQVTYSSRSMVNFLDLSPALQKKLRDASGHLPEILLTRRALQTLSRKAPLSVGSMLFVDHREVRLAGIVADNAWPLSTAPGAWLIEPSLPSGIFRMGSEGFVLGRPQAGYNSLYNGWWLLTIPQLNRASESFECIALQGILNLPRRIFLFSLLLALLALPATTPLRLGEYPSSSEGIFWNLRRGLFFIAKLILILAAVGCWSIAIAYAIAPPGATIAICAQVACSLIGFLWAFRWVWLDQRNRCPVCLQRLANPTRVGHASQMFLGWSGTEWVCVRGHGLLYVPALPTSWLSLQRWLKLDSSWTSLFSSTPIG